MATLVGDEDSNYLLGSDQDDSLDGRAGNDTLEGGGGNDSFTGGMGADVFHIVGPLTANQLQVHTVSDLGNGQDVLRVYIPANHGVDNNYDTRLVVNAVVVAPWTADARSEVGQYNIGGQNLGRITVNLDTRGHAVDLSAVSGGNTGFTVVNTGAGASLTGSQHADALVGGDGNDTLSGGPGADSLTGGSGADLFILDSGEDTISDLGQGADSLVMRQGANATVSLVGDFVGHADDFDPDISLTLIASDGQDADISELGREGGSFTVRSNGNSRVSGSFADDHLLSFGSGDTLMGGEGADDFYFEGPRTPNERWVLTVTDLGKGADSLRVFIPANHGVDNNYDTQLIVNATVLAPWKADARTELAQYNIGGQNLGRITVNLSTEGHAVDLSAVKGGNTGFAVENTGVGTSLTGSIHADTLLGGAGNDLLLGGSGFDLLDGSGGRDTVSYSDSGSGVTVSLLSGASNPDALSSIEAVLGSEHGDELTGNGLDNSLWGSTGDDTLSGGEGEDLLDGGPGKDTASYASAALGVVISLAAGASNPDSLVSIENLVGSAFADSLTGSGVGNALDGGSGNDTLVGGDGPDTLRGGPGDDLFTVESSGDRVAELPGEGTDTIQTRISYSLQDTDGAGSEGGQVENLVLLGTAAINGTGNGLANRITGNNAANTLAGFGGTDTLAGAQGPDTLNGGLGNDSLSGGVGADRLIGGLNNDVLTGGDGEDTFVFDAGLAGNVDRISDFAPGADTIELDDAVFGAFTAGVAVTVDQLLIRASGTTAKTPDQLLIYNQTTGRLYYDADGSEGAFTPKLVAILAGSPALTVDDFIVG